MTDNGSSFPRDNIDLLTALLTAAPEGGGRRERTRNALLQAGLTLIAAGETEVPVLTITRTAGVSNGSFYNFFDDKQQFFEAAAEVAAERLATLLDRGDAVEATGDGPDITATVCTNFRIIGRVHRMAPVLSRVLIRRSADYYSAGGGFISRVRRDVATGVDAGVFHVSDREGVVGGLVGAMVMLGQRLHDHPELDAATTTDAVTRDILRMLGVADDEADRVLALPLPFG